MPILPYESDIYPDTLLESPPTDGKWWAAYTLARREKVFMERLRKFNVSFYSPLIKRTTRSPSGRREVVTNGLGSVHFGFLSHDSGSWLWYWKSSTEPDERTGQERILPRSREGEPDEKNEGQAIQWLALGNSGFDPFESNKQLAMLGPVLQS